MRAKEGVVASDGDRPAHSALKPCFMAHHHRRRILGATVTFILRIGPRERQGGSARSLGRSSKSFRWTPYSIDLNKRNPP